MDGRTVTLDEVREWPATVSVDEAVRALGVSRSHGYHLAQTGEFPCKILKLGDRVRVVTASLIAALEGVHSATNQGEASV